MATPHLPKVKKPSAPKVKGPKLDAPPGKAGNQGQLGMARKAGLGGGAVVGTALPIGLAFGGTLKKSGYSQELAKALAVRKKAAMRSLQPAHSALLKQKVHLGKNVMSPLAADVKKAKAVAKSGLQKDLAGAKKVAPLKSAKKGTSSMKSAATLQRKALAKRLQPAHSALIKQKLNMKKSLLSPLAADAKKAKGMAKKGLQQDLAHAKKVAAPLKAAGSKEKAALKSAATMQKKALARSLQPAHSALIKQKKLLTKDLHPAKSMLSKDLRGIKKSVSGMKTAAEKSSVLQAAKKQEAAKKKSLLRLLRIPGS